ncbi:hypothetical protein C6503_08795 [Candidatus Poribacteria bacterium]|nr:MAG: hypothetical protein C6503_08795 [Candidatus Poribacteria bacterium]
MMKIFRQYLGVFIAGVLLFFLIKPFIQAYEQLGDTTFQVQWRWLVISFGFILLYRSFYVWPFTIFLRRISEGRDVYFRDTFTLFHLSNITRYLPGRIWGIVKLLELSPRFGLSKTAVGSCLALHTGIETALGGLIAMFLLFSTQMQATAVGRLKMISGHTLLFTLVVIGLMGVFVFLMPILSLHARRLLKTLQEIGAPLWQKSSGKQWCNFIVGHFVLWCCQGFAFFLFVRSLTPVAWTDIGILTACYAFAWIVGFLSFLTPSGLGIREGLLGLLLSNYMPVPQATLVALLCRVWMLSAEIILAGVAIFLDRSSTLVHAENPV